MVILSSEFWGQGHGHQAGLSGEYFLILIIILCITEYFSFLLNIKVLGFFEESFTGVEQTEPYEIQVGYSKVRSGSAQQLTFTVITTNGTASKLHILTVDLQNS